MVTNEQCSATTTTYRNPTVNAMGKDGMPPLFRAAVRECNPNKFKELLENGAKLDTIYEQQFKTDSDIITKRQNIIEAIASFLTCQYFAGDSSYKTVAPEKTASYLKCAEILLDHCVKNNIQLHVNPEQFSPKKVGEDNLWEISLFKLFDEYRLKYPNLFSREYDDAEISGALMEYVARVRTSKLENKFDSVDKIRPLLRNYAQKYPEQYLTHETVIDYFCNFYRYLDQHPELTAIV